MEQIDIHAPIGQLAVANPGLLSLFERLRLDYCCRGEQSLAEACRTVGVDVEGALAQLLTQDAERTAGEVGDPAELTLCELADHIEERHHVYLRRVLPELGQMLKKIVHMHGDREPWLADLQQIFLGLAAELDTHIMKEEQILFPLVRELETAEALPVSHCGSVGNPIAAMENEHDSAGRALMSMRRQSDDFQAPLGACNTFRGLMAGLAELEEDLHQHIHKENNILFVRAIAVEKELRNG
jgi:regulator of cell morphogenesis and NO signaling